MATRIVIRVDASTTMGTGHVVRCLSLAEELRERRANVTFLCRELDGNLIAHVAAQGFTVHGLSLRSPDADSWLGATWEEDARDCASLMPAVADWLVTDHYRLDARWHEAMRPHARRIMAIDDLADRPHACDLLLDQNEPSGARYAQLVPDGCTRLLGPRFALLQAPYARLHAQCQPRAGAVRRILLFFGGADRHGITARALEAVSRLQRPDLAVDVVVGSATPDLARIRKMASERPQVCLHTGLPSLAPLMVEADLAIGAGGVTTWERLCVGLPTLVVTVADNQVPTTRALAKRGLVEWVGDVGTASVERLAAALRRRCDEGNPAGWFPDYTDFVDGKGTARVCEALLGEGSGATS